MSDRWNLPVLLLAALCALPAVAAETATASGNRPPNIVLILADDLGAECLGCYWNPELWVNDKPSELGKGKFGDDLFTAHICAFMRAHKERSFFVYYPMTLVHSQTATGMNYPPSPDTLTPGAKPDAGVEPKRKGFGDLVAYMDKLVGKIADEIDALGLAENTLLLFVGDNGTDRVITSRLGNRPPNRALAKPAPGSPANDDDLAPGL